MKAISSRVLTISIIVIVLVLIGIIAYAIYPIERDRPADIRPDLWFDTKDYYQETADEVDTVLSGGQGNHAESENEKKWSEKYLAIALDSEFTEHTRAEYELTKAMQDMKMSSFDVMLSYYENKRQPSAETKKKFDRALERYEDAKRTVEKFFYVWK